MKIYGMDNLVNDIHRNLGFKPNYFFRFAWKYLCPILIMSLIILYFLYTEELKYGTYSYPAWSVTLGWCFNLSMTCPIPLIFLYVFIRSFHSKMSWKERLENLFTPANSIKNTTSQRHEKDADNLSVV